MVCNVPCSAEHIYADIYIMYICIVHLGGLCAILEVHMYNVQYASCSPSPLSSCCAVNDHFRSCQALVTPYKGPLVSNVNKRWKIKLDPHISIRVVTWLPIENPLGYFLLQVADAL